MSSTIPLIGDVRTLETNIFTSFHRYLYGDVPVYLVSKYLLVGCEALLNVKQAFRSTAIDLPPEESTAPYHSITLPETFDLDDFELPDSTLLNGFGDGDASQIGVELDEVVLSHIVLKYSMLTNSWSPGVGMTAPRCLFGYEQHMELFQFSQFRLLFDYGEKVVKKYDKVSKSWVALGGLPERSVSVKGWGLTFSRACGERLIVIGGPRGLRGGMVELNSWIPDGGPR
ncbi:uncharacterized protein A4U43_C08F23040 [Asparagus officinalis]|nr:uncharacterized protein A4U43_C08F23040 [Asparagus officinalis]